MNRYSYRGYPSFGDWWTDGEFISSQETVAIAIQEYLYRFPQSPNADRLRWQLAFINSSGYEALPGNEYDDDWIVSELQKALDEGTASRNQLENVLDKFWFDIAYAQPIENLFADGKTGMLYVIAPQVWADEEDDPKTANYFRYGGLFIVVRELHPDKFQVILLRSAWNFSFSESSIYEISDHNQNGVPEIALYIGSHGGTMCGGNLFIYEWNGNVFDELTKGELAASDCSEGFEYPDSDGIPAIIFSEIMPTRKELYIWNGASYEFARFLDATPLEVWWYSYYGSHLSYHEEVELLKQILESNVVPGDYPTMVDNLRYRLGVVEALDGQSEAAIRDLQSLISAPNDSTRTIFPRLAKKFLETYKGPVTLYNACHQSELLYAQAFEIVRNLNGPAADEKYLEIFGIPLDPLSIGYVRCNEEDAFRQTVSYIPTMIENLPAELRKLGVHIQYSQKMDANLDGKSEEWLVIFDTYNHYLIFPNGSQYQAEALDSSMSNESTDYSSTHVSIESWNTLPSAFMFIYAGHELSVVDVDQNNELLWDFEVIDYKISNQAETPQFQVFYSRPQPNSYYPEQPWNGYRWNTDQKGFTNDLLEFDLFIRHQPQAAAEIVDRLLPVLDEWKENPNAPGWRLPYTYYICSLSYEFAGNVEKAAQVYWQLWHDFPNSHYALLAKYKLESINP